jgi:hypothetical protein
MSTSHLKRRKKGTIHFLLHYYIENYYLWKTIEEANIVRGVLPKI